MICLVVCLSTKSRGVVAGFAFDIAKPKDHARAVATALLQHDITPFWQELEVQTELIDRSELGIPLTPIADSD